MSGDDFTLNRNSESQWFIQTPQGGGYNPSVFMRHTQPSEIQTELSGGVYGGVYVIVMEGVINNNKMLTM